jgi:uncharacterized repeat protein (TIGR03803 family)
MQSLPPTTGRPIVAAVSDSRHAQPHRNASPEFSVVATITGGPLVGAISGSTLYATIRYGAVKQAGALYSVSLSDGTYTLLHDFNRTTDGANPNGQLAIDKAGNVIGTATTGGTNGTGTIWEYTKKGVFGTLYTFGTTMGDGANPLAGPTLVDGETLAGTASAGGASGGNGTVFQLKAKHDAYSERYAFQSGSDGHTPDSGVVRDAKGNLYGTTVGNGSGGEPTGTVWELSKKGVLTTLYVFKDGADGEYPDQTPTLDAAGNLYGSTYIEKGNSVGGAIWTIDTSGQFSVLHQMDQNTDGGLIDGPLLLDVDGNFYGSATVSGMYGFGTVFQITPSGTLTVMHAFSGGYDGTYPTGPLVHDAAGNIYGGTVSGQIFEITP